MRIIAGEFRSRRLLTPGDDSVTRPMPDRVRESLFSLLRGHFEGANVLDCFAGTGAVGLEAVSRGAASVMLVERHREIAKLLQRNVDMLGVNDRAEVVTGDALGASVLARAPRPLHLAFFDPPYPLMREPAGFARVMAQVQAAVDVIDPTGFVILRTPWPLLLEPAQAPEEEPSDVRQRRKRRSKHTERRKWREDVRPLTEGESAESPWRRSPKRLIVRDLHDLEAMDELELPDAPAAEEASAQPVEGKPVRMQADLSLPNALGPETHVYHTMAVHLYMRKPAS